MCGASWSARLASTVPAAIQPAERPMTSMMQQAPSSVAMLPTSAAISITVAPLYLTDRTVARAVVGVRQVVVNGLGHADDAHFVTALDGLLVDFMGGVLGIIAADVKEIADVVRLEDLEQAVHVPGGLFGLFLEINFVTAGAQRGGRGVFEALDGPGLLLVDINQLLVEHAEDAVEAAVDFLDAFVLARFLDDARHAGVDDRGGAARLCH